MLWGMLRLVRLSNSLPASALVLLGAKLADTPLCQRRLWLAMLAMWSITAFGYVSNDLSDHTEDRINKPDRPLPAAVLTKAQALGLALSLLGLALLISRLLGWLPFLIALFTIVLLLLYNWRLKGAGGLGNLLIAGLAASALLPGVVAVAGWRWGPILPLLPAALALASFILARELLKTIEDMAGDQVVGKRTVALGIGVQGTLRMMVLLTLLLFATVTFFFGWWGYTRSASVIMVAGVVLPLGWSIYYLTLRVSVRRVRTCLALLKGCYFVGLVALWLA